MKKILFCLSFMLACSGTVSSIDGQDGTDGDSGGNGSDGKDGSNGKDGKSGLDGTDGSNGVNGKDNKLTKFWSCNKKISTVFYVPELDNHGVRTPILRFSSDLFIWYHAAETAAGDTYARGAIDSLSCGPSDCNYGPDPKSSQSTEFWAVGTTYANQGFVSFTHDIVRGLDPASPRTPGIFRFYLNKTANTMSLTYTDPDMFNPVITFNYNCE